MMLLLNHEKASILHDIFSFDLNYRLVSYTDFIQRMERKNTEGHSIDELIADGEVIFETAL